MVKLLFCGIQDTNLSSAYRRHISCPSFHKMKPVNVITHALWVWKTPRSVAWIHKIIDDCNKYTFRTCLRSRFSLQMYSNESFKSWRNWIAICFTTIYLQNIFSRIGNCKLVSSQQMSSWENKLWIQKHRVRKKVRFISKFNCSSAKCSGSRRCSARIVFEFLGFMKTQPACRPATYKKFKQCQVGQKCEILGKKSV